MEHSKVRSIFMPEWVKPRATPWVYAGILHHNITPTLIDLGHTYEELLEKSLHSDHGEIRECDEYPQGAAFWYKE